MSRTFLKVYLQYDLGGKKKPKRLTAAERIILRTEIAHLLNGNMPAYSVLKKELGEFYFEEPREEL